MPITLVLSFQPLPVTSVHDGAPPFRVLQVPEDGLVDAGGEIHGRLKPQFAGDFGGVDGIAAIMTGPVAHMLDQVGTFAALRRR